MVECLTCAPGFAGSTCSGPKIVIHDSLSIQGTEGEKGIAGATNAEYLCALTTVDWTQKGEWVGRNCQTFLMVHGIFMFELVDHAVGSCAVVCWQYRYT
jgi:hypothetical protein